MRKRFKIMLLLIGGCMLMTGVFLLKGSRNTVTHTEKGDGSQSREYQMVDGTGQSISQGGPSEYEGEAAQEETPVIQSKYELAADKELTMDLSYIADFISRGKQFILKRQIRAVAGEASEVKCLEYQISDPEDMRMEFFLLLNTGEVLRGYYSYYTAETSVEKSDLTEEAVYQMMEEEKQMLEAERKKAEQEKLEAAKQAEKEKETEKKSETKKKIETEADTQPQENET